MQLWVISLAAISMTLFLMVELIFQSELLAGNKTVLGKILHFGAGFFGGYFFHHLISSERSYTFIIRFLGIFYAYWLFGLVLEWVFTPVNASAGFDLCLQYEALFSLNDSLSTTTVETPSISTRSYPLTSCDSRF